MEESSLLNKVDDIFGKLAGERISWNSENAYINSLGKPFALLHSSDFKSAEVLRVPTFRRRYGKEDADEYKRALKGLAKIGCRIERHNFLGPIF